MKLDIEMKARLMFTAFLALVGAAGLAWYVLAATRYAVYQIYTRDPVSGLIVDAPIEFHGVEVGKVKRVSLVDPHLVSVLLNVEKGAPVSSATVATIISRGVAARGFTGYVYIALEDVGTGVPPLAAVPGAPYPVIRTVPSKIATLDTAMNQVNDNVQATTALLRSLLDQQTVASLRQSVESLRQVSKVLADNSAKLGSILATAERASRRIEPLLQSGQQTVNAMQDLTQQVGPLLESSRGAIGTLQSAGSRLGPLLESSQGTLDTIQNQLLPQATKALAGVDNMSDSFTDLASKVNRDPSVLIRGTAPPRPGPGEGQ
jgi:phospholipid/cholesterol/gamma-HCH transport system substrate-binding protein